MDKVINGEEINAQVGIRMTVIDNLQDEQSEPWINSELYDGWLDRQFEQLQMVYCITCKCFIDGFADNVTGEHHDHALAFTAAQKTSEEVIARLSE